MSVNIGTDKVLLEMRKPKRVGRKGFDHANIAAKIRAIDEKTGKPLTTRRVRQLIGCSARLIRQVHDEMKKGMWGGLDGSGLVVIEPTTGQDVVKTLEAKELDFNEACKKAMGYNFGFLEWLLNNNNPNSAKWIFGFCKDAWELVGSPSIVAIADRSLPDGQNFANAFLQQYRSDTKRLRRRKKHIRRLMAFLNRHDINENFFKMREEREPIEVRHVPQIGLEDFPAKLEAVIMEMREKFGIEGELLAKLKLTTMLRTGSGSEDRELWGIKRGANGATYLVMNGPDDYVFEARAKGGQRKPITWIPKTVRELLWEIFKQRKDGEPLFKIDVNDYRKAFKEACVKHDLPPLNLHDLRKVSITWLYAIGIPLEIAIEINKAWKSIEVMRQHYLTNRDILKKDKRIAYRDNIPEWFKEGLDQYVDDRIKNLEALVDKLTAQLAMRGMG